MYHMNVSYHIVLMKPQHSMLISSAYIPCVYTRHLATHERLHVKAIRMNSLATHAHRFSQQAKPGFLTKSILSRDDPDPKSMFVLKTGFFATLSVLH